jgi:hypothetical protein
VRSQANARTTRSIIDLISVGTLALLSLVEAGGAVGGTHPVVGGGVVVSRRCSRARIPSRWAVGQIGRTS